MASRRHIKVEESQVIRDVAAIMAAGTGPWTRTMIAEQLEKIYPQKSLQELKNEVSYAMQTDRFAKKRFKIVRRGWWDLAER